MNFEAYQSFKSSPFNSNKDELIERFGNPSREKVNNLGWKELDYENFILRLDESGNFVEATSNETVLEVNQKKIDFRDLQDFLKKNDEDTFESYGFVVSPKFGIAFDPHHESWVTFFRKSELVNWKKN